MKPGFKLRILSALLALPLGLSCPPQALALRAQSVEGTGTEELSSILGKPSRRGLLAWAAGLTGFTYLVTNYWPSSNIRPRFLDPDEIPYPWAALFQTTENRPDITMRNRDDTLTFWINEAVHLVGEIHALDRQGRLLGEIEVTGDQLRSSAHRVVDPRTGEGRGFLRMDRSEISVFDRSGRLIAQATLKSKDRDGRPLPGHVPEALPGSGAQGERYPVYRVVSRNEDNTPAQIELVGFLSHDSQGKRTLLDSKRNGISFLEPVWVVTDVDDRNRVVCLTPPSSRASRYFKEPASEPLVRDLQETLRLFQPTDIRGKRGKILLAHRLIQLQVLLGQRTIRIDPMKARETAQRLRQGEEINLENPADRRLLWEAIGNAHPWYAIARQAVRELGWQEDERVLRFVLGQLQCTVLREQDRERAILPPGIFDARTREMLLFLLQFQSLSTREEITEFFDRRSWNIDPFLSDPQAEWTTKLHHVFGLTSFEEFGFSRLRSSSLQWLALQAAALERAGYPTYLISLAPGEQTAVLNDETKTVSYEWVLLIQDKNDPAQWHGLGLSEVETRILSGRADDRLVRLTQAQANRFLQQPINVRARLQAYPTVSWDVRVTVEACERQLRQNKKLRQEPFAQWLGWPVELRPADLFESESRQLREEWVDAMAQRFDQWARRNNLRVEIDRRLSAEDVALRKAGVAAAVRLLPAKVFTGLRTVRFAIALRSTYEKILIVDGKEVRIKGYHSAVGLYSGRDRSVSTIYGVSTPLHELAHHWQLAIARDIRRHLHEMDVTDLYTRISWEPTGRRGEWRRRPGEIDLVRFFGRTHALLEECEDLAIGAENYGLSGQEFRLSAQAQMDAGDFVLAAKYLFLKYIMWLDEDGRSLEFQLTPAERLNPFTFERVLQNIERFRNNRQLPPEIERLRGLILQIRRLWEDSRDAKRIVRGDAARPVLGTGVEEQATASISNFLQALAREAPRGITPVVIQAGLEEPYPQLRALSRLKGSPLLISSGNPTDDITALISRWDAREAVFVGFEDTAGWFRGIAQRAGVRLRTISPGHRDFVQFMLAVLAESTGIEEAAIAARNDFGHFLDTAESLALQL